jgi:SAM-dependent methyltransferase
MIKCSFCDFISFKKSFIKVLHIDKNRTCRYYKCSNCGSLHQYTLPNQNALNKYYESYIKIKQKMNPGYLESCNINSLFAERDKTLKEIGFDKNIIIDKVNVELGCANGFFLQYLKNNGATKIIGIDVSKSLLKTIKIKNIKLINGDLFDLKENYIDILYMFNILEHIPDQKKLLKSIKTRLKSDGLLLIEVPLAGIISNLFKNKWRFLMPDEHLHIPSMKALKNYLTNNGFKLLGYTRFGSGFTYGSINKTFKNILDFSAKFFKIGDRGAFLFKKIR